MMRTLLDWLLYARSGGQFLESAAITAHFAPDDLNRYRRYLPDLLDMPARPVVKLFLVDYLRCSPWPLTRYQEWSMLPHASRRGRNPARLDGDHEVRPTPNAIRFARLKSS